MNEGGKRFTDFVNNSKTLRSFYVGDNMWIRHYGQNMPKWVEGKITKKIGSVMYETKIDVSNCGLRKHINQLRYRPCIDDIAHSQDKPLSSQENTIADPPRIAEQSQHLSSPEYLSNEKIISNENPIFNDNFQHAKIEADKQPTTESSNIDAGVLNTRPQ